MKRKITIKTFKKGEMVSITQWIYKGRKWEVIDFMMINWVPSFGIIIDDNELVFIDQEFLVDGNERKKTG